jgi:hypothetical protein
MKYGRYETLKELGRGSMGVVYEAYDPQIDRTLALKVLRPDYCANEPSVLRFLREAQTIGRLSHPRIVTVYDAGEDRGTLFMAMELLEGRPLNELLSDRRFTPAEILELGIQIAETLEYAHSKGVVHRDIKPSNILVQPDGSIKITDFGIAHIEDPDCTVQTREGEILGTPAYMSPEQVRGGPVDGRSDLFSLGVILYQLSTGQRPFGKPGSSLAALFHAIAHVTPPEPAELNPEVTSRLSMVIMRCLNKDPSERYASGAALSGALRECLGSGHAGPLDRLLGGLARHASTLGFPQFYALAAVMLAGALFYLLPQTSTDMAGAPGTFRDAPTAVLTVQTRPAGAAITVDGAACGNSPLEVQLPPGRHRVTAKLEGHAIWSRELSIDQATSIPLDIQFQALGDETAPRVFTAPPGAILLSVAASAGSAPAPKGPAGAAVAEPLAEARREEREGSDRSDKLLSLQAERAEMLPEIQGILEIESTPAGAEVLVDGQVAGTTPFVSRVPEGEHVVVLREGDRNVWQQRLKVESGEEYPFKVALNGGESILAVESDPPGARILVDGVEKGTTPSKLQLPPGKHQVRIRLKRHKDYQAEVDLARTGEHSLNARLKPSQPAPRRIAAYRPPPPDPVSALVREARYQLSPRTLWRRVQNLF